MQLSYYRHICLIPNSLTDLVTLLLGALKFALMTLDVPVFP